MNIGIDIDDTIVDTITPLTKYANIYNRKKFGATKDIVENGQVKSAHYLEEVFGWDEKIKDQFFCEYYKQILEECKIRKNASKILNKLKDAGNTINFITARYPIEPYCNAKSITVETLKKYKIPCDNLVMEAHKKADACKKLNIDVFIDDSYEQCKFLQENGIKSYLITTKMNNKVKSENVERVTSWNDFYDKIISLPSKTK